MQPPELKGTKFFTADTPVYVGDSLFTIERKYHPHRHDFYEFFIVRSGSLIHHHNGSDRTMHAGTLWFVLPEDTHCFSASGEDALITNVAFTRTIAEAAASYLGMKDLHGTVRQNASLTLSPHAFGYYIERVGALAAARSEAKRLMTRSLVADTVSLLALPRPADSGPPPQWLSAACDAMQKEENYLRGLERFIGLAGKSQEHVTRSMRDHYGVTPTEFINNIRLDRAAFRMRAGSEDILDIAFSVGFNNSSHFIALFKKRYGVTPSAYRRQSARIFAQK